MSGFVSMREYVAGDDPRMIHWPTTARTGTLMVREHVEVRRPEFTVVLDTAPTAGTADDFEEAVDVAATLAVHAIRTGLDVVVRTTDHDHAGRPTPLVADAAVLDLLTPVQQSDDASCSRSRRCSPADSTRPRSCSSRARTGRRAASPRRSACRWCGSARAPSPARASCSPPTTPENSSRRWRSWG